VGYNVDVGKKVDLSPCKRCGALSPKPLSRDGTHRVADWPTHDRGFLCDACRGIYPSRVIASKPCKRCGTSVTRRTIPSGTPWWPDLCEKCRASAGKGDRHPRWSGGRSTRHKNGYVRVFVAPGKERALEHRVVWERAHGPIPPGCHVHHKNGQKQDNRLENLTLVENRAHQALHREERSLNGRWSVAHDRCADCGTTDRPYKAQGLCRLCYGRRYPVSRAGVPSIPSQQRRPRDGRWSVAHAACLGCGTTERRHEARGLCQRCYWHATRRT